MPEDFLSRETNCVTFRGPAEPLPSILHGKKLKTGPEITTPSADENELEDEPDDLAADVFVNTIAHVPCKSGPC
jgi:hypothetical protein